MSGAFMSNGKQQRQSKTCFVIMPISDPDGYEKDHFVKVYEDIFKFACIENGYDPIRADENKATNLIHLEIVRKLIECDLAICDLSSRNPNVLFELGIRQAFDRPTVIVQESGTKPIFDISGFRYIEYDGSLSYRGVLDARSSISEAVKQTESDAKKGKSINSIVRLMGLQNAAKNSGNLSIDPSELISLIRDEIVSKIYYLDQKLSDVQGLVDVLSQSDRDLIEKVSSKYFTRPGHSGQWTFTRVT